ncbi:MAG: hypothetical protein WCJ64_16135 [Rhodospirillaceae bacterium]
MRRDSNFKVGRDSQTGEFKPVEAAGNYHGPVIRQLTLPGGKKVSILREDIFQRALHPDKAKGAA